MAKRIPPKVTGADACPTCNGYGSPAPLRMICPDCGGSGARQAPVPDADVPAMLDQIATLRADLAASQREVERLRHGEATAEDGVCPDAVEVVQLRAEVERLRKIFDDAGHGEHNVLALVDYYQDEAIKATAEVERLRTIVTNLVGLHCAGGPADFDSERLGPNADALRYLASIGRVEIVSEQGRRVVARWTK